jgi:hypothetical protein
MENVNTIGEYIGDLRKLAMEELPVCFQFLLFIGSKRKPFESHNTVNLVPRACPAF